jgi:hypothetical protein
MYCLSALLRAPDALVVLTDIDDTFDHVSLPRFGADDFTHPAYGQIFLAIRQTVARREAETALLDQVRSKLDGSLMPVLDAVEAMPTRPGDQPAAGAVQSALRLRHRNTQRMQQELHLLIQAMADATEKDWLGYVEAQRANTETLRKLDRVMRSHEWIRQTTHLPF